LHRFAGIVRRGRTGNRCRIRRRKDAGTRADASVNAIANATTDAGIRCVLGVGDSSCGGGWSWVDHVTRVGAQAPGLGDVSGEIVVGNDADFLLVDLDVPEMMPSWDITWELVRLANRDQINGVFVAGKLRLWNGWPTDWDGKKLMAEVGQVAKKLVAEAPIKKVHEFASEHQHAMHVPAAL
jgi:5-methylthioadenosine/S-adenosylhomocysteine deaminase